MALPVALGFLLVPIVGAIIRVITATAVTGLIYYFLTNTVKPYIDQLSSQVINTVSDFSTIGGTVTEVIVYLDFVNCVSLLLSASTACFSLKIMSVAIRAFGINTGS